MTKEQVRRVGNWRALLGFLVVAALLVGVRGTAAAQDKAPGPPDPAKVIAAAREMKVAH